MSEISLIYYGNDMLLELTDLTNNETGSHVNTATVTVTLTNDADTSVAGDTWPKTMDYVAGSDGVYRTTLLDTLTLTRDARYLAKISANAGEGLQGYWEKDLVCKIRK